MPQLELHVKQGYTGLIYITTNFVRTLFGITSSTKWHFKSFATESEIIYNRHTVISLCTVIPSCMSNLKFCLHRVYKLILVFQMASPFSLTWTPSPPISKRQQMILFPMNINIIGQKRQLSIWQNSINLFIQNHINFNHPLLVDLQKWILMWMSKYCLTSMIPKTHQPRQ
jgi:hypothetical protein